MAGKKLTQRYWNSLSEGSRKRALTHVFPLQTGLVDMLVNETPNLESPWWKIVFRKARIPEDHTHYKTVINQTYIP